jgi:hypothetical protein
LTPEKIAGKWKQITDFSGETTHPESPAEATSMLMKGAAAQKSKKAAPGGASGNKVLEKAQSIKVPPAEFKYDNQEGMISLWTILLMYSYLVQSWTGCQERRFEMGLRRFKQLRSSPHLWRRSSISSSKWLPTS